MKKTLILLAAVMSLASCAKTLDLTSVSVSNTTRKTTTTSTPRTVIPSHKGWGTVLTRSNTSLPESNVPQVENNKEE